MNDKFKDLLKEEVPQKKHPDTEDLSLWSSFKKSIKPLARSRQNKSIQQKSSPQKNSGSEIGQDASQEGHQHYHASHQETFESFSWDVIQTFSKPNETFQGTKKKRRLRRRATPEATIDFHGMTQKEAFHALYAFIKRAHFHGLKTVRVVTGKGVRPGAFSDPSAWNPTQPPPFHHSEGRAQPGILRQALPTWLKAPPLSAFVSDFTQARTNDGGEGAWYLFL